MYLWTRWATISPAGQGIDQHVRRTSVAYLNSASGHRSTSWLSDGSLPLREERRAPPRRLQVETWQKCVTHSTNTDETADNALRSAERTSIETHGGVRVCHRWES